MEEEYFNTNRKKVDTTNLVIKEFMFLVVAILFFVQYYKILGYLWDRYVYGTGISDSNFYLILIFGVIPLSYFSTKYVVKLIKKVL
jgi:hypothetical protein